MWGALLALGTSVVQGFMARKGEKEALAATQAGEAARLDYMKQALTAYEADMDKVLTIGKEASERSIAIQKEAGEKGRDLVMEMLQKGIDEYAPYKEAGLEALETIRKDVTAPLGESPFYKWQQEQGQKAIDMAFAARGGFGSGAAVEAKSAFQQELGGREVEVRREQLGKLAQYGYGAAEAGAGLTQRAGETVAGIETGTAKGIAGTIEGAEADRMAVFGKLGEYRASLIKGMGGVKAESLETQGQIRADTLAQYSRALGQGSNLLAEYYGTTPTSTTTKKTKRLSAGASVGGKLSAWGGYR